MRDNAKGQALKNKTIKQNFRNLNKVEWMFSLNRQWYNIVCPKLANIAISVIRKED